MLFYSSEKLNEYATFGDVNFPSIQQHIEQAEENFLIPYLSQEQYEVLNEAYSAHKDNEDTMSDTEKLLLHKCRRVVAPLALMLYMPEIDVDISTGGIRRTETEHEKTAYGYQFIRLASALIAKGESAIETLLLFLEKNAVTYPEWAGSDAFQEYQSVLIRTGKEFAQFFPSGAPYRNYWSMRPKMKGIEMLVANELGEAVYTRLKTGTGLNKPEKDLLFYAKSAVAYFTVAAAIPYMSVRMDGDGLTVVNINNPYTLENKSGKTARQAADASFVAEYTQKVINDANEWLSRAKKFLAENGTDIGGYVATIKAETQTPLREEYHRGSFGMF